MRKHAGNLALAAAFIVALTGCPCLDAPVEEVVLRPLDETEIEAPAFGYALSGPWDLDGYLIKDEPGAPWRLEGLFTFPTSGYYVAPPGVIVRESYPEQVSICLPVNPPPPDAIVLMIITHGTVSAEIAVSDEATFDITVAPLCATECLTAFGN